MTVKILSLPLPKARKAGAQECAKDLPEAIRFWNSAFLTTKGFSPLYKLFLESTQGAKATLLLEMLTNCKFVIASFRKKAWQSTINKKNREHLTTSSTLILFLQNIKSITTNYKAYLRKSEVSSIF